MCDDCRNKATAIFVSENGVETWIMPSVLSPVGYVYGSNRHAGDVTRLTLSFLSDYDACVKSPVGDLYHVWHICTCYECTMPITGGWEHGKRIGGRVWDHSQGAWNEHLRYVENDKIFTFPTVGH